MHFYARAQANKIKANLDPYPLHMLSKEPAGETVFITTPDSTRLRAITAGSGPTVVLVHGYAVTVREWNILFEQFLALGCRVIAFDLRGHGQSTIGSDGITSAAMAGDIQVVLEHFDVRDAVLVGHSAGGFLSIRFMLDQPQNAQARLKGVVLMAALAGNVLEGAPQNRLQIPLLKSGLLLSIARSDPYGWLFGASLAGQTPAPSMIRALLDMFVTTNHKALLPMLQALGDEDYYPRLGEIKIPCVVVCGTLDQTTPRWHSERLGKAIAGARNMWLEGKGHIIHWEAPQAIVEAVQSLQR
ncbi:MAG: alpha/beta hydrolase [Chloroflexi bacterium]|nr:alpha/beta hydrolase [Chloroflexota bacterium]